MSKTSKPGTIHLRIVEVLKRYPTGVSGGQIRQEMEREGLRPEDQTHLDRRKRDLKNWFVIEKLKTTHLVNGQKRTVVLYRYIGERAAVTDEGQVNQRVRAEVIRSAHGQCRMCGQTIEKHGITLVVDHRKPREWGGSNDRDNLWAICEDCNAGKKAFFSSLNATPGLMRSVLSHKSVHVRIGELLKAVGIGRRTPSSLIDVVADQDDWHKRLRELRYPVIGWEIDKVRFKDESGRIRVDYILRSAKPWPEDPSSIIRGFERDRELKNKRKG